MESRLKDDVAALAKPGGRVSGSNRHAEARAWVIERLRTLGLEPYTGTGFELRYERNGREFFNVAARLRRPGNRKAIDARPVLIAAHLDTCGVLPGADDNAAAVVAALAAADDLRRQPARCDVVFCFFDAEEPPYFLTPQMGSIRFYEDQRQGDFRCAIVMDLIGHAPVVPGLEDVLIVTGAESLGACAEGGSRSLFEELPAPEGIRLLPMRNDYVGDMSDHHVFRTRRQPYLFLTCGEWPDYHRATDTADRVDYGRVAATARYLGLLSRWLAEHDTCFDDSLVPEALEVARFVEVAGPALQALGYTRAIKKSAEVEAIVHVFRGLLQG